MIKGFNQFALLIALFATAVLATAEEHDLCSPFLDGKVDSALLETMLSAAQDGHLYRVDMRLRPEGVQCVEERRERAVTNVILDLQWLHLAPADVAAEGSKSHHGGQSNDKGRRCDPVETEPGSPTDCCR